MKTPLLFFFLLLWSIIPSFAQDAVTYAGVITVTVTTNSTVIIPAGLFQKAFQVCTTLSSTTNVWLNPSGGTAVVNQGVPVYSAGGCTNFGTTAMPLPREAVTGITDGVSSQSLAIAGG